MTDRLSIPDELAPKIYHSPSLLCAVDGPDVPRGYKNFLHIGMPDRLAERRVAFDLGAGEIGVAAGLSKTVIAFIEDRRNTPRVDTAEAIATALGISPTWLVYGPYGHLRFQPRMPRDPLPPDPPAVNFAVRPSENRSAHVAERARRARALRGLSLRALARAAGVSTPGIVLVEQGNSVPLVSTVEAIAIGLDVAPGWLAFGEGEGPETSAPS